jgi:hypothetical protein
VDYVGHRGIRRRLGVLEQDLGNVQHTHKGHFKVMHDFILVS